jgi:Ca-activated chloride channel homolog
MEWYNSLWLWTLLLVPVVFCCFLWVAWKRRRIAQQLGDPQLIQQLSLGISPRRRRWKALLFLFGFMAMCFALAGPRFGAKLKEVKREGVDLMIALDVSNSMMAEDVSPNRLTRAKFEVAKMLEKLKGDRVGLVAFAGDAFLQCPFTLDYSAMRLFLDITDPSLIATQGTDYEYAIKTVIQAFETDAEANQKKQKRTRVLLVISDGENHAGDLSALKSAAKEAGITIFTAGIGETDGAAIPLYNEKGEKLEGYKSDKNGQTILSKLEESGLKSLADDNGYIRLGRSAGTLEAFPDVLARLEKNTFASNRYEAYEEKFMYPLFLALLLLSAEWLIGEKKKGKKEGQE